ncbi:hypothetical protein ES708_00304 [subsurface metagenome]
MKLAIAQMVLGAIIVADFALCQRGLRFIVPYYFAFLVLGLLVLGCGIAQYLKARGAS